MPPGSTVYYQQVAQQESVTYGAGDHSFRLPIKRFQLVLTSYIKTEDLLYKSITPAGIVEESFKEAAEKLHKSTAEAMTKYLEEIKAKRTDITWAKGQLHCPGEQKDHEVG